MRKLRHILLSAGGMNALSSVLAVVLGLFAGFIILLISNPSQAVYGFVTILTGGALSMRSLGQVLTLATPIILTGLSVGFAGKTGLFNIGATGQFTFGMFGSILTAVKLATVLPGPLLLISALLAGVLAGALWGLIPGMLKALRNVHEVISCIMMNYIGVYLVNFLIREWGLNDTTRNSTLRVPGNSELPKLGLDTFFSESTSRGHVLTSSVGSGILIAILVCIIFYIVLEKTKFGYELKACGFNHEAARYAGINEKKGVMLSMVIAGGLAGLGGALVALSGTGRGIDIVDMLAAEGFQGIPVALLGLFNPIGIIFSGFLIAYFKESGFILQLTYPREIVDIIVAVIIYFSALALLLKGLVQFVFRERKRKRDDPGGDNHTNDADSGGAGLGDTGLGGTGGLGGTVLDNADSDNDGLSNAGITETGFGDAGSSTLGGAENGS